MANIQRNFIAGRMNKSLDERLIPNGEYEQIMSMIAKPNEEQVDVINVSLYHTQKNWMSNTKTQTYKYPCVYTVNSKSEITYYVRKLALGLRGGLLTIF